ncbi:hypothetical protein M378DRAFT_1031699 [Amanita muscaria Koide BX008]|uniref:Tyrosine specific protein phosphatases domain-containing protein n=1 Tax=Amanita muscaria (strain Koide BX008) TaxID=946122 RepID=A0A0C2W719_AMAMK|nr:hypothetical protein M378DRAFT_1031699 [Amanita muscaria Koide BX008]
MCARSAARPAQEGGPGGPRICVTNCAIYSWAGARGARIALDRRTRRADQGPRTCDDGIDTLEPQLEPICDWIDKARQLLVHCRVGVSRNATVTIAYVMKVMKHLGVSLVDAYLVKTTVGADTAQHEAVV